MKSLPIRMKLSLWYFSMFATAACLLSLTSWWMLHRSLDSTEYHELQERAEDVQTFLAHQDPSAARDVLNKEFAAVYAIRDDGKWLQVMDQDGNWIYRSNRMIAAGAALATPSLLSPYGHIDEFHQGTRFVRTLAYPITVRQKRYSVQAGVALNKSMVLLNNFAFDLLLLTPAVIVLAALGGHWMSRRALRPVALLAAEARRINDRNLDLRLPVSDAQDEISDLSQTLNQMLERIDKAFASVRAFTGNASHELRTPIALLRTEIEVSLYRPREGSEYRATLTRLHEETIRMTNLIEDLLSLARADGGAETVTMAPIHLDDLFRRIAQSWKRSMDLARLDFAIDLLGAEGLIVMGDPAGVSRILAILIENAARYTAAGGAVTLSATRSVDRVTLLVQDTGIGISTEDLPRIFDRFYRGIHASDSVTRGSGLGLALAKWIAERHGTRLIVQTEVGRGSTFSFSLQAAPLLKTKSQSEKPVLPISALL